MIRSRILVIYRYAQTLLRHPIDTLVLGCTHYPVLKDSIQKVVGNSIQLVDSPMGLITELEQEFDLSVEKGPAEIHVVCTGSDGPSGGPHDEASFASDPEIHPAGGLGPIDPILKEDLFMIKGIYGTMYYVANIKQAIDFYRSTLGLKPTSESEDWTEFELGGAELCLHSTRPEGNYPLNGLVIFEAHELKKLFEKLKSQGLYVFNLHEVYPEAWTFHMRDHNGNEHTFYGHP